MEIASRLFFQQGYHVTGIKQIIDEAGVAKGTFYCHFKSKEELGLEWLRMGSERWTACRDAYLDQFGDDPEKKLIGLFDFQAQGAAECNFRGCAFLNMIAEIPDLSCPMRQAIQGYKSAFRDFIRGLVDQHLPDAAENDRAQRAGAIYLLFEGATVAAQSFCATDPIRIAKRQVALILSPSPQ